MCKSGTVTDGYLISGEGNLQPEEAVAETCAFELFSKAQTVRRNTKSTDTEAVLEAFSREKLQVSTATCDRSGHTRQ